MTDFVIIDLFLRSAFNRLVETDWPIALAIVLTVVVREILVNGRR